MMYGNTRHKKLNIEIPCLFFLLLNWDWVTDAEYFDKI